MRATQVGIASAAPIFFFKQKAAYGISLWLGFRRVLFRSAAAAAAAAGRAATAAAPRRAAAAAAPRRGSWCASLGVHLLPILDMAGWTTGWLWRWAGRLCPRWTVDSV